MKKHFFYYVIAALSFAAIFTACDDEEVVTPTPAKTLYERLGGVNAISAVVDQFIANVAADPEMKRTFQPLLDDVGKNGAESARLRLLRANLIDQIGEAAGGPLKYKGKDMVTAHKGMKITDKEFNALVADLVAALNKFTVPAQEQTELLTVLGGLKGQIVGQ
jgi:hemoglobin